MADKFLNTGGSGQANISNGTANIYAANLAAANLDPSRPIKTNAVRELVSQNLDIADVNNLQATLDNVLTNPFNGTLQVSDLETDDTFSLNDELQKISNIASATNTPDITVFNGEVDLQKVKSLSGNAEIELDDTDIDLITASGDVNINANSITLQGPSLTFNGYDLITEQGNKNLDATLTTTQTSFTNDQELITKKYVDDNGGGGGIEKPNNCLVAGVGAGATLTSGTNNILFGLNAGQSISVGSNNFAIGRDALKTLSIQTGSIAIGDLSQSLTVGTNNVTIGHETLKFNTTGGENVIVGNYAGGLNITGGRNSYFGHKAGYSGTNQSDNVAVGDSALEFPNAPFNTAIGKRSQQGVNGVSNGGGNTSVGYNTLFGITSGTDNVAVGVNSGGSITSGQNNTFIGPNAGGTNITTGQRNTALGWQNTFTGNFNNSCVIGAGGTCDASNQVCLGDGNVNQIINSGDGICDLGSATHKFKDVYVGGSIIGMPYDVSFACTDEVNTITTTGQKMELRCPRTFQTTKIKFSVNTAGGGLFTVNIKNNGTVILSVILGSSTVLDINNTTTYNENDIISAEVLNVGSGTATGLKVYLIGETI